ncbi:MAG: hypothetical protein KBT19_09595 [Lachnospiraceae bacterium]|nr:hypothetical protein [Candidatus Colinaster equi]
MNEKLMWDWYDAKNYYRDYFFYRRSQWYEKRTGQAYWPQPVKVAGKKLLSTEETNQVLYEGIISGRPFWAGRFGGTEMKCMYSYMKYRFDNKKDNRQDAMEELCRLSGFFPNDIALGDQFTDMMIDACGNIDVQAEWSRYMEDYFCARYQKNAKLTQISSLYPWTLMEVADTAVKPWTTALEGKKVLVIHPFEESIRSQYDKNRMHIFDGAFEADDILPKFQLDVLKAVQTLAGEKDERFATWFEALDWMIEEIKKRDFDVAILGCGAYAYLLANEIKKMGKCAIHLGGATQLLFGIYGSRWKESTLLKTVYNEKYWIHPCDTEQIKNHNVVENSCYW